MLKTYQLTHAIVHYPSTFITRKRYYPVLIVDMFHLWVERAKDPQKPDKHHAVVGFPSSDEYMCPVPPHFFHLTDFVPLEHRASDPVRYKVVDAGVSKLVRWLVHGNTVQPFSYSEVRLFSQTLFDP